MYQCVSGNVSNVARQIPFSCVEDNVKRRCYQWGVQYCITADLDGSTLSHATSS